MRKNVERDLSLRYLYLKPQRLNWYVVAGPPGAELSPLQAYDLIYDEKDLKIRRMDTLAKRASRKPAGAFCMF